MRSHDRIAWAALAAASAGVLLTARMLTPSATGVGTHTQLGLPPCGFLALLGVPCPACGLTTAFAHLAHGDVSASLAAHPLGFPLFLALLGMLPGALSGLAHASPLALPNWVGKSAWIYVAALLAVWLVRLICSLSSGAAP